MNYVGYMLEAYQNDFRDVNLTQGTLDFLNERLALHHPNDFSAYQIYSAMKTEENPIAYKNVHQKVHKLLSLGLIQEVREGYILHGAKYYQISLNGWFNIILKSKYPHITLAIKHYYDKNIIFKTFLYPYFELDTISFFLNYLDVSSYLRSCCQTTLQTMILWESYSMKRKKLRHLSEEELRNALKNELDVRAQYQNVQQYTLADLRKEIAKNNIIAMTFISNRSITEALDLHVKSFLFGQILEASHEPYLKSALAEDRKFMAAVKEIGEEFNKTFDMLSDLGS